MSYRCLVELGEDVLPAPIFSKIAKLSAPSNPKASPSMSSSKDSETDCSPSSPCGTISKHFQARTGEGTSTSYLRDFLAHRIALLGSRKGQTMSEIFGPTQCPAFAKFDPESLSLRTHPELCPVALSSVSSKTLPKQGMMRTGVCYLLPRPWWERTIYASGGGAERPWLESDAEDNPFPTPTSSERSGINPNTGRGSGLSKFVKEESWPTPAATDGKGSGKTGEPRDRLDYAVERGETKSKVYDKPPPGGGQLSADWTDWLVGFPILWSSPDPLPVSAVQEWLAITLLHDWWAEEPPIPRTIERGGDKHRCRRLKGIGNAQVPLCAAVAYTILELQQEASEA